MTDRSATTPVVTQPEDTRTDGPMTGGERAVLDTGSTCTATPPC